MQYKKLVMGIALGLAAWGAFASCPVPVQAAAASIAISGERATANYWTSRDPAGEQIMLNPAEIETINASMRQKSASIIDLAHYPTQISGALLKQKISAAMQFFESDDLPEEYKGGALLTIADFRRVKDNCALKQIPATQAVRYALTTQRLNLRLLPETDGWFESPNDTRYDDLQGTAVDPAEPVAVLWESLDKKFVFVEMRNYAGWIDAGHLAYVERDKWLTYVTPKNFLVVTANQKRVHVGGAWSVLFQMGSRIPLKSGELNANGRFTALIPVDVNGVLNEAAVEIAPDNTVHQGWLPCTKNNFVRQAFRFLGDEYGWGGMNDSVDCSSFVADVYRTMGIELPRDADQQELAMPKLTKLEGHPTTDRWQKVRQAMPGSLLFKPGHVMMYLGEDTANVPLVIHAASSYFTFDGGVGQKHYIRRVLVSDLHYQNSRQVETIDGLTAIGSLR